MQWSSHATSANFEQEVTERSRQLPVLVDFWAEWCAPCRALAPELEAAVAAREGQVWLVKVDTEQAQDLAARFGIRGIPAVKAFVGGRAVDEFVGALTRGEIDAFIDRICPSAEERALAVAEACIAAGRGPEARQALAPLLDKPRLADLAQLLTARAYLTEGNFPQAWSHLEQIPEQTELEAAVVALRIRLELLEATEGAPAEALAAKVDASPDDADARWALAGALLAAGAHERALEQLLELLRRGRRYREDGARRAMLMVFDELGPDSDLARDYRRQLQILT